MSKNIPGLKRGFSYRQATAERGGLGLYTDGLLVAEYENYGDNDELVVINGKNLTGVDQWFTEESETQNYKLGTRMAVEDMVFRYAHIHESSDAQWRGRGLANLGKNLNPGENARIPFTAMTEAAEHATSVTLTVTGITANEFENGAIAIFPSTWTGIITGRVRSNAATSGASTTFTLKEGVQATCGSTSTGHICWNPYKYTGKASTSHSVRFYVSQVGCLCENSTADYYVWLQTWGPYMGQYSTYKMGYSKYSRAVYFDTMGGMLPYDSGSAYLPGTHAQYAGFCLGPTYDGTDLGDAWTPWVFLQISP